MQGHLAGSAPEDTDMSCSVALERWSTEKGAGDTVHLPCDATAGSSVYLSPPPTSACPPALAPGRWEPDLLILCSSYQPLLTLHHQGWWCGGSTSHRPCRIKGSVSHWWMNGLQWPGLYTLSRALSQRDGLQRM